jgi:hypothetical protein
MQRALRFYANPPSSVSGLTHQAALIHTPSRVRIHSDLLRLQVRTSLLYYPEWFAFALCAPAQRK